MNVPTEGLPSMSVSYSIATTGEGTVEEEHISNLDLPDPLETYKR